MELVSQLFGTVWLRPYVFVFLAMYLFVASRQMGWARTVLWTVTGYGLAWAAEWSSTHGGFPFGDYHYIHTTRERELWVAGVPFMDSLSFTFLTYIGYSCAWQLVAAFRAATRPLRGEEHSAARRSAAVLVLGAAITTLMEGIIDPVALLGDRGFLGLIYGYDHGGQYFGIPLTNFAGWFLVSAVIIGANQVLERLLPGIRPGGDRAGRPVLPLGGFVLFCFVVGFNLAVTAWLGERALFASGLCLVLCFLLLSRAVLQRGRLLRAQAAAPRPGLR